MRCDLAAIPVNNIYNKLFIVIYIYIYILIYGERMRHGEEQGYRVRRNRGKERKAKII